MLKFKLKLKNSKLSSKSSKIETFEVQNCNLNSKLNQISSALQNVQFKKNKKNFIFIFQNIKKTLYLWYRNEQLKNEQNEYFNQNISKRIFNH